MVPKGAARAGKWRVVSSCAVELGLGRGFLREQPRYWWGAASPRSVAVTAAVTGAGGGAMMAGAAAAAAASHPGLAEKYEVLKEIGTGAFSRVNRARLREGAGGAAVAGVRADGGVVAIKDIAKSGLEGKLSALQDEIGVLKRLHHGNIMKLYEVFESDTHMFLVLQLAEGGELFDRICDRGSYTEKDASNVLQQAFRACAYMHEQRIVHRDLKPENLLCFSKDLGDSRILIGDFGLARVLAEGETLIAACGTPGYVAPEVLASEPYSFKADCFSLGVIAYILLCGYPPFYSDDDSDAELFRLTLEGAYEFDAPYWDEISDSAKDFVRRLMETDQGKRLGSTQALEHPWLDGETAKDVNIHKSVAEMIKKNFARKKWKQAINTSIALGRLRLSLSP